MNWVSSIQISVEAPIDTPSPLLWISPIGRSQPTRWTMNFSLYSNFTYFLEDPVLGDEFEQRDSRRVYGFNLENARELQLSQRLATVRWGIQTRLDDVEQLGLYRTQARTRFEVLRADSVKERSVGAYAEVDVSVTDRLRAIAGMRGDYYDWDVKARQTVNEGSDHDTIYSPKLSLAYRFTDAVEWYANWGRGFHSNDVRGATITVDPLSGEAVGAADALVATEGAEIGLRVERGERFNATLVGFWLELDSELVFVGDAGGTEASSGSKRTCVEASAFWQMTDWLAFDANYTFTDAEFNVRQSRGNENSGCCRINRVVGVECNLV